MIHYLQISPTIIHLLASDVKSTFYHNIGEKTQSSSVTGMNCPSLRFDVLSNSSSIINGFFIILQSSSANFRGLFYAQFIQGNCESANISHCEKMTSFIFDEDHPYLDYSFYDDDILVSRPDKRLICYPRGYDENDLIIFDGIEIIGDSACLGCSHLTDISFRTEHSPDAQ